jgi:hypothetical protein
VVQEPIAQGQPPVIQQGNQESLHLSGDRQFEIEVLDPRVEAFAFTFG